MSDYNFKSSDDDFELEIISLDALPEQNPAMNTGVVVQGRRLAPKIRFWLAISLILLSILFIFLVLPTILPVITPKPRVSAPIVSTSAIDNVTVVDGRSYVLARDGILHVLRVTDGSQLWQYKFEHPTSPLILQGVLYVKDQDDRGSSVLALHSKDGLLLWSFRTASPEFEPLIVQDGVAHTFSNFIPKDHMLSALRSDNGSILWQYRIDLPASSNLYIQAVQDNIYLTPLPDISTHNSELYVLKGDDGTLLWRYRYKTLASKSFSVFPVIKQKLVYITEDDGSVEVLHANNGSESWHYKSLILEPLAPTIQGNLIYVSTDDHSLAALRADSGSPLWTYKNKLGILSLLEEVDGIVYFVTGDDTVHAIQSDNGKQLWSVNPVTSPFAMQQLIVADGYVYVSALGNNGVTLYALRSNTGSLLWQHEIDQSATSPGLLSQPNNGVVYITTGDDAMEALRESDGTLLWGSNFSSRPALNGFQVVANVAFICSSDSVLEARNVRDGAVLWRYPKAP